MLLSANQTFSDAQAITATAASTNVIDLGATGTVKGAPAALIRDVAKGNPIPVVVQLDADASAGTRTLSVALQVDSAEGFGTAVTVATAALKTGGDAGDRINLNGYLPEGTNARYLRLNYTLGGSGGSGSHFVVSAFIPGADQTNVVPGA